MFAPLITGGCETPPGGAAGVGGGSSTGGGSTTGGGSLFAPAPSSKERWTIRALHTSAPGHQAYVLRLAEELKRAPGLKPNRVRIVADATGSSIYYGEYVKIASPAEPDRLVFPADYQRDIDMIRRLIINQTTPFFYAEPELVDKPPQPQVSEFDVSRARGTYTLYVAVFYNTPGFDQRREAAEQYVALLRQEGYSAYYRHEDVRSYVFVGDFTNEDIVAEPGGAVHYGPRVEALINQRPEEFRHLTENGHLVKYPTPSGQLAPPQSYLVPVPREGGGGAPAPRERPPAPFQRP